MAQPAGPRRSISCGASLEVQGGESPFQTIGHAGSGTDPSAVPRRPVCDGWVGARGDIPELAKVGIDAPGGSPHLGVPRGSRVTPTPWAVPWITPDC